MVLHLGGCGRVGHRHNNLQKGGARNTRSKGPTTFLYSQDRQLGGASLETRKTASTAAPFLRMDLLLQPARVNTRPVVSEHHAYARNAATLESPRLVCNSTASMQRR